MAVHTTIEEIRRKVQPNEQRTQFDLQAESDRALHNN